jgi:hypothetical protein
MLKGGEPVSSATYAAQLSLLAMALATLLNWTNYMPNKNKNNHLFIFFNAI